MYKQLVILLFNFIVRTKKAWKECSEAQDTDNAGFLKSYLYPVFGIIALFSFAGILLYLKKWDVQIAIKQVVINTVSCFAGFYIAVFALSRLSRKYFGQNLTTAVCERFTGYASAAAYVITMFYAFFPFLTYIQLLTVYTFYIVWQGSAHYLQIKNEYLTKFTIFAGIIIILAPLIMRWLLVLTIPGAGKF